MSRNGFILSEVLIVLVIIGVLAAILVPSTIHNTNSHEYRSGYKKAISVLNQALARIFSLERMTAQDYPTAESIVQKRLSVMEHLPDDVSVTGCTPNSRDVYFITTDGMIFCVDNYHSDMSSEPYSKCDFQNVTPCVESEDPNIWVDVNGAKTPNKLTVDINDIRDVFPAVIFSQRVLPYGGVAQAVIYEGEGNEGVDLPSNPEPPSEQEPPSSPENPSNPETPDIDWDADGPDENNPYYDDYNQDDWPSWQDFLNWLWDWLKNLIT